MPPVLALEGNKRPPAQGEVNYWAGLNILGNIKSTSDWLLKTGLAEFPKKIDYEWLTETKATPKVVAVMRGFARAKNTVRSGEKVDLKQLIDGQEKMAELIVGELMVEDQDDDLTNVIVPMRVGNLDLELVINSAWGSSWRLKGQENCWKEAEEVEPAFNQLGSNEIYINPQALGEYTDMHVIGNTLLAMTIRDLLVKASEKPRMITKYTSSGNNFHKETILGFREPGRDVTSINLAEGHPVAMANPSLELRQDVSGWRDLRISGGKTNELKVIGNYLAAYYNFA
ncbi:MAG TPA: hypothetical protein VJ242_02940 [Patescibacteria group bacterium]|nr:hypothetical protein [Patescibacteria group bacterium]